MSLSASRDGILDREGAIARISPVPRLRERVDVDGPDTGVAMQARYPPCAPAARLACIRHGRRGGKPVNVSLYIF
jgi:hypothetical protein